MVQRQKVLSVVIIMMLKEMMMTFNVNLYEVDDHDELKPWQREGKKSIC